MQPILQESLRSRQEAVITTALDRLLTHVRRGHCTPLFEAALAEFDRRLARLQALADGADLQKSGASADTI